MRRGVRVGKAEGDCGEGGAWNEEERGRERAGGLAEAGEGSRRKIGWEKERGMEIREEVLKGRDVETGERKAGEVGMAKGMSTVAIEL